MKYIINTLTDTITRLISDGNKKVLVKLEGFDDVRIYANVCCKVDSFCKSRGVSVVMKLSQEKFDEFKSRGQYTTELNLMEQNHWVNFNNTMTYYRNLVSTDERMLILLMGTEMVQDKGGIYDIDTYTPQTLEQATKENCSRLFNLDDPKDNKTIDTIYKQLFDKVPINIYKLSNFADLNATTTDPQDLIEAIFRELPIWGLPMWVDNIPKRRAFEKSSKNQFDELLKFIQRKDFQTLSEKKFAGIKAKVAKFVEDSQDVNIDWQEQSEEFTNFTDYSNCLMDYIVGKDVPANKQRLLNTDYAIAKSILKLKNTSSESQKDSKHTEYKLYDSPLLAVLKMVLYSISGVEYDDLLSLSRVEVNVDSVEVSISTTKFSEDTNDKLLIERWKSICMACGDVVGYVASRNWSIFDNPIEITSQPRGILSPENAVQMVNSQIVLEKNVKNALNKVSVTVKLYDSTGNPIYKEGLNRDTTFVWQFKNEDAWIQSFRDVPRLLDRFSTETDALVPFGCTDGINRLVNVEDDEVFFDYLEEVDLQYKNVLDYAKDILGDDGYYESFKGLGKAFMDFCNSVNQQGFFSDLLDTNHSKLDALISSYTATGELLRRNPLNTKERLYLNEYVHAFAIEKDTSTIDDNKHETDSVITPPFHPCTLEKLKDKCRFILDGIGQFWDETISSSVDSNALTITDVDRTLRHLDELSQTCFSVDVFPTNKVAYFDSVNDFGYYSVYKSSEVKESLYSKNVLDRAYLSEDAINSEVKNVEETPESRIYLDVLNDYKGAFPNRANNLSLVFVNTINVKPIVSAIYYYVKAIQDSEDYKNVKKIKLDLLILPTENENDIKIYLSYWINKQFSQNSDLTMNVKVKSFNHKNVESAIPNNVDIIFYSKILQTDEISLVRVAETPDENLRECKFPIVIKPYPSYSEDGNRYLEISQNRFKTSWVHTQLVTKYKASDFRDDYNYIAIKKSQLPSDMVRLLNDLHEKSFWNVCIDNGIDKSLMCNTSSQYSIVGYSTGKGSQGQYNVTITARKSLIDQLKVRLKDRLRNLFHWDDDVLEKAVEVCVRQSCKLDGLKLFKSINVAERNIREHMAYILTSLYFEKYYQNRVDVIVSLDSYMHWFSANKDTSSRPDFLYLQVVYPSNGGDLNITAEVIECKISSYANKGVHLNKATKQANNGLKVLSKLFDPNSKSVERRYWYSQLYRLLTFQTLAIGGNSTDQERFREQLRGILLGKFNISWSAKVLGYWYDMDGTEVVSESVDGVEVLNVPQCEMQSLLLSSPADTLKYVTDATFKAPEIVLNPIDDDSPDVSVSPTPTPTPPTDATVESVAPSSTPSSDAVKFLVGNDRNGQPIYWHFGHAGLANRHLLITGSSGQGKTYAIQTLLSEASKNGISAIVVDYTDGFTNQQLDERFKASLGDRLNTLIVYDGIAINPFKAQEITLDGVKRHEKVVDVAQRVANIFKQVYDFGDQQFVAMYKACLRGLKHHPNDMSFEVLSRELEDVGDKTAKSVLSKVSPFFDGDYIKFENPIEWKDLTHNGGSVTVIQLSNIVQEIQLAITEFILWDMWYYMQKNNPQNTPFIIVLDEAQNLSFKANSPNRKILLEGRKFGWSAWYSTQFLTGQLDEDEISELCQAETKIFFKPASNDISRTAKMVDAMKFSDWIPRLSRLSKGRCIVTHQNTIPNVEDSLSQDKNDIVHIVPFEAREET